MFKKRQCDVYVIPIKLFNVNGIGKASWRASYQLNLPKHLIHFKLIVSLSTWVSHLNIYANRH